MSPANSNYRASVPNTLSPASFSPFTPSRLPPYSSLKATWNSLDSGSDSAVTPSTTFSTTNTSSSPTSTECQSISDCKDGIVKQIRSLPNSPFAARRAKSVYVSSGTAIRFFSPTPTTDHPGGQSNKLQVPQVNGSKMSMASPGRSVNRVVWSKIRFFETLSQADQQRWRLMITNNKIAEESRLAAAAAASQNISEQN